MTSLAQEVHPIPSTSFLQALRFIRKIFPVHLHFRSTNLYHDYNNISKLPDSVTTSTSEILSASRMIATQIASSNAGLPPNSYIYNIISTAPRQDPLTYSKSDQLAIISSDDSLRFLDPATLDVLPGGLRRANDKVTCLERANDAPSTVVATAGRDGLIRFWDNRSRQKALEIESRKYSLIERMQWKLLTTTSAHKLISALVCNAQRNFIAAGIENPDDGPGVSPVYVWYASPQHSLCIL